MEWKLSTLVFFLVKFEMPATYLCRKAEWTFGYTNLELRGEVHDGDLTLRNHECLGGI